LTPFFNMCALMKPPSPYRRDIDGLRALAVLAVVGFHAFPAWVKGGYIGVDIFFVISGYLISTILFETLRRNTVSFVGFYVRRIRRIFPSLITVLVSCLVFGWFALLSDEYRQLGKHIAGGAGFLSNFLLWSESGYFDAAANTKPLLHLWSLGIEEQFYILWPLLLWGASKIKLNLLAVTSLLAFISFGLNIIGIRHDLPATFYAPQTRFWELMIGAMLAYVTLYGAPERLWPPRLNTLFHTASARTVLSCAGLVLLLSGLLLLTQTSRFPGFYALLPTLGAACLIAAGPEAHPNRFLLSNKLLVWIGLISFPLYLWHWPLLSFARLIESDVPSRTIRIGVVIASIGLADLTTRVIERPLRFGAQGGLKALGLLFTMIVVGGAGFVCYQQDGFRHRQSIEAFDQYRMDTTEPTATRESDGSCETLMHLAIKKAAWNPLDCQTRSAKPEVLFVGDSHAMSLYSAIHFGLVNLNAMLIAANGCLPFENYIVSDQGGENKTCRDLYATTMSLVREISSIKTVVLLTRGPLYFSGLGYGIEGKSELKISAITPAHTDRPETMFATGYAQLAASLLAAGKKVVFVIDVPELGKDPRACLPPRPFHHAQTLDDNCRIKKEDVLARQAVYRHAIASVKKANPALTLFDGMDRFCDSTFCYGKSDGKILYWDDNHPSISGSKLLLEDLQQKVRLTPRS